MGNRSRWHRRTEHFKTPVRDPQGIVNLRLVISEIMCVKQTVVSLHLLVDGGCDLASVQGVLAFPSDSFESVGEIALDDLLASRGWISVW